MTIETVMKQFNISVGDLAKDLGIPLRTIYHWLRGDRLPPPYLPKLLYEFYRAKELDKRLREWYNV